MNRNLTLLNEKILRQYCQNANAFPIACVDSVGSTNDHVRTLTSTAPLQFCLAEHQTQGRGRLGRAFVSPPSVNVYLSCRWHPNKTLRELAGLSLVVSVSILDTLHDLGVTDAKVKWPNDILWQQQKLAGVLVETANSKNQFPEVIIGIGLNVNMPEEILAQLGRPATSLKQILAKPQDRNRVAGVLIKNLVRDLTRFTDHGFKAFKTTWMAHDALKDQTITVYNGTQTITGIASGVDDEGNLLLCHQDKIVAYAAGDVSLNLTFSTQKLK